MIAIDWSHQKGLTSYNGKKVSVVDRKTLLKRLEESKTKFNSIGGIHSSSGADGESNVGVKSKRGLNPSAPLVILEQGCPLSLTYDILKTGCQVSTISKPSEVLPQAA